MCLAVLQRCICTNFDVQLNCFAGASGNSHVHHACVLHFAVPMPLVLRTYHVPLRAERCSAPCAHTEPSGTCSSCVLCTNAPTHPHQLKRIYYGRTCTLTHTRTLTHTHTHTHTQARAHIHTHTHTHTRTHTKRCTALCVIIIFHCLRCVA